VEFLHKVEPEAPSHSDPDLFSHDAKRNPAAMVPAAKEIFQKNFAAVPRLELASPRGKKARLAGSVNHL
jgi:hypothetical protein